MCNSCIEKKPEWFFEKTAPHGQPDYKIGIAIKEKLFSGESKFQDIEFYDTHRYGKIMVLDGMIQTSEKDEFIYHEMMVHLPLFYHPNPKKILIIGGGDGGILEEVLKHPVESVTMVEIDGDVIELSKKFLPSICKDAFNDSRADVIVGDGKEYIENHKNEFDVIILDLSDPIGPAAELIGEPFYQNVCAALKKNGVTSIQSGSFTYQPEIVKTIYDRVSKIFSTLNVHHVTIPTYEGGEFSLTLAGRDNLTIDQEEITERLSALNLDLQYYSPSIHFSSSVLPKYLEGVVR